MSSFSRSPRLPRSLPIFLVAAFLAGALLERTGLLPGSHRPPAGLGHTFDPFWEAWRLVDRYYVDRERVQPKTMTQGAIEGMLASLGDYGHTTYLTKEEFEGLESGLEGQLEGIGARITVQQRRPTIVSTMSNSPARAAGLLPGDVRVSVDGKPVGDLPLDRVVEMVRGRPGTTVRLRVIHKGQAKPVDLEITRARVDVPDVTWHMLPGEAVAHVAIQSFGKQADAQLREALDGARGQGARALLVDVRANPGGLKEQAVAVTSEFIGQGNVFLEKDAEGKETPVPVRKGGHALTIPMCVLIDEGTASSAEIFAGAIQDHRRAKLVGAKTVGTGTVLGPFKLSDGSAVLLAIAEWLTPNGRKIWHEGIPPDVDVALPEGAQPLLPEAEAELDAAGLAKSNDKQLLRGLQILKEQIPQEAVSGLFSQNPGASGPGKAGHPPPPAYPVHQSKRTLHKRPQESENRGSVGSGSARRTGWDGVPLFLSNRSSHGPTPSAAATATGR